MSALRCAKAFSTSSCSARVCRGPGRQRASQVLSKAACLPQEAVTLHSVAWYVLLLLQELHKLSARWVPAAVLAADAVLLLILQASGPPACTSYTTRCSAGARQVLTS